jgi:hypothetical protein
MAGGVRMGLTTSFGGQPVRLLPMGKGVVEIEIGGTVRGRATNIAQGMEMAVDAGVADGLLNEADAARLKEPPSWQHFTFDPGPEE